MGLPAKKKYERELRFDYETAIEVPVNFVCYTGGGVVMERTVYVEVPVALTVDYNSGEAMTRDHPGCPPDADVVDARYKGGYPSGKARWLSLALQGAGNKFENLGLPSMSIAAAAPTIDVPATNSNGLLAMVFEQNPTLEEDLLEQGLDWLDWEMEEGR